MKAVILCSGPSMTPELADQVKTLGIMTVAVNDAFTLAPWAHHLVAQDTNWWKATPDAFNFAGDKWSTNTIKGVNRIMSPVVRTCFNSGAVALELTRTLGAKQTLLLGVDLTGTHFFGLHTRKYGPGKDQVLKNTTTERFNVFRTQFNTVGKHCKLSGMTIFNGNPNSMLRTFEFISPAEFSRL